MFSRAWPLKTGTVGGLAAGRVPIGRGIGEQAHGETQAAAVHITEGLLRVAHGKYGYDQLKRKTLAATGARFTIKDSKWDYFLGRVKSNPHNEARSLQNLKELEALGIKEAEGGREKLMKLFDQGLSAPEVKRIEVPGGMTIVRLIKVEGKGFIEINYFYKGSDFNLAPEITNIIPKPFK